MTGEVLIKEADIPVDLCTTVVAQMYYRETDSDFCNVYM